MAPAPLDVEFDPMSTDRFLAFFFTSAVVSISAIVATHAQSKSVNDGVYTSDQAARGEQVFQAKCASCHYTARFVGEDLLKAWANKPLADLFSVMRESMPEDNPGTLPIQDYTDALAYFLQLNKYPTGTQELVASEEAMGAIMLERPK